MTTLPPCRTPGPTTEWERTKLPLHYGNGHDVRDLLQAFAELSRTIETTPTGVMVSLDPPDTPLHPPSSRWPGR